MGTVQYADFASSIRYSLMPRSAEGGRVEIILDLFRGSTPALTKSIATVPASDARTVLFRCQRHLERLGAYAVSHMLPTVQHPQEFAPVAAFDWIFDAR